MDLMNAVFIILTATGMSHFVRHSGCVVELAGTSRQPSENFRVPLLPLGSVETSTVSIDVGVF